MPDQQMKIWWFVGDGEDSCGCGVRALCLVVASTEEEGKQMANNAFASQVDYADGTKWFDRVCGQELGVSRDANPRVIFFSYA